jgi:hypothetical protein
VRRADFIDLTSSRNAESDIRLGIANDAVRARDGSVEGRYLGQTDEQILSRHLSAIAA